MATTVPTQDASAMVTFTADWSTHLTAAGGLTISSATVTCSTTGVTVGGVSHTTTGVSYQLAQTGLTAPLFVTLVVTVVLSNSDTDVREIRHQFV